MRIEMIILGIILVISSLLGFGRVVYRFGKHDGSIGWDVFFIFFSPVAFTIGALILSFNL